MPARYHTAGQGLLESIIAIGVMVTGVVSLLALNTYSLNNSEEVEARIVASNLAREAIEAVRVLRDSNWLAGRTGSTQTALAWDTGLYSGGDITAVPILSATFGWSLDFTPNSHSQAGAVVYRDSGVYRQYSGGTVPGNASPTRYTRLLSLYSVCRNSGGTQEQTSPTCLAGWTKAGLRSVAEVQWKVGTSIHDVVLEEYIYNWRFAPAP